MASRRRSSTWSADDVGNFLVTWMDLEPAHHVRAGDPGHGEVSGQRFGGLRPQALQLTDGGNGVWEPDETASLRPTWRNVNGPAQTFSGRLRNLAGPPGAGYVISIDDASYGTVADGGSAECGACYLVVVQNQGPRPVPHWDATADELITPDLVAREGARCQPPACTSPVFGDVPASHPFSPFIQELARRGVASAAAAGTARASR